MITFKVKVLDSGNSKFDVGQELELNYHISDDEGDNGGIGITPVSSEPVREFER